MYISSFIYGFLLIDGVIANSHSMKGPRTAVDDSCDSGNDIAMSVDSNLPVLWEPILLIAMRRPVLSSLLWKIYMYLL